MSEEEMNKYFNDKYGCSYKRLEELFDFEMDKQMKLVDKVEQLEQENKQLKERIDKAIEYLKENEEEYGSLEDNEKIILEILKGEK